MSLPVLHPFDGDRNTPKNIWDLSRHFGVHLAPSKLPPFVVRQRIVGVGTVRKFTSSCGRCRCSSARPIQSLDSSYRLLFSFVGIDCRVDRCDELRRVRDRSVERRLELRLGKKGPSARNALSISAYEKLALRPLGFGSTTTRAPSKRSVCGPRVTGTEAGRPKTDRYSVTPTKATIFGFHRRTLRPNTRVPATYSSGRNESMPRVALGMRLVMPNPHSGKR
jgi:hypothetical protein